jgi:hypothetical protein
VVELRRRGALPPIITVLIILGSLVATGLVVWFMFTTTRSAVNQPVLEVTEAYATGTAVTLAVRNVGSVDLADVGFAGNPQGACSPSGVTLTGCSVVAGSLAKGNSAVVRCTASAAPGDGDTCTLALQATNQQTGQTAGLPLSFKVVTP